MERARPTRVRRPWKVVDLFLTVEPKEPKAEPSDPPADDTLENTAIAPGGLEGSNVR
jgi:hypothetical protein